MTCGAKTIDGDFFANNRILFVELLDFFSLAAQEYLPHPEYEAEDHQGDFRKPI